MTRIGNTKAWRPQSVRIRDARVEGFILGIIAAIVCAAIGVVVS